MAMREPYDEMSFEEFKEMMAAFASASSDGPPPEFCDLLESGCSEADAKRWLTEHITEFPEPLRGSIMEAFAGDLLRQVEEPKLRDEHIKREFREMWNRDGFLAATAWVKQQQRKRRHGNR